ncbi:uncharacterized protein A4U43_C05F3120 [Asparagus officinalis]|uniref:Non-haem dioxygenase N-terminal domain-containing protein n=1 Tax=Asparagus officinalis TaxID=4686 RepID=A0A5P1ERH1_ASPOF|nr:uncharacterized protein A4U43_C05F3120 [Asparagus officinalis]
MLAMNHGISEDTVSGFLELALEQKNKYSMSPDDIEGHGQAYAVSGEQKLDWSDLMFLMTLPTEIRKSKITGQV